MDDMNLEIHYVDKQPLGEEVIAAYDFLEKMEKNPDFYHIAPMWYGWALRDAFLAGFKFAEENS